MSSYCLKEGVVRQRDAGITVFLTIVYLTLIVFSCSLVEITRINIAKIQAERALISASQSVLGGYDSYLKEHYGIFARNENYGDVSYVSNKPLTNEPLIQQDLAYYVHSHIDNEPINANQSLIDQYVLNKDNNPWQLTEVQLNGVTYESRERLFNPGLPLKDSIAYIKQDIVGYMEIRTPALFLEGLAEQFGAFEKVGKTGQFIQAKNECVEQAGDIQSMYEELYTLVEGIEINKDDGSINVIDQSYIKRMSGNTSQHLYYQGGYVELGSGGNINDGSYPLTLKLNNQVDAYDEILSVYNENLTKFRDKVSNVRDGYDNYVSLTSEIEALEKDKDPINSAISDLISEGKEVETNLLKAEEDKDSVAVSKCEDELLELNKKISLLSNELAEIEDDISDKKTSRTLIQSMMMTDMNTMEGYYDSSQLLLDDIELLTSDKNGNKNYLSLNNDVAELIEQIEGEVAEFSTKVDGFINDHESDKDLVIGDTYEQTVEELEMLKKGFSDENVNGDPSYDIHDNLKSMLEFASANSEIITNADMYLMDVRNQNTGAYYDLYVEEGLYHNQLVYIRDEIVKANYDCLSVGDTGNQIDTDTHMDQIDNAKAILADYNRDFIFDYTGYMSYDNAEHEEQSDMIEALRGIGEKLDITSIFKEATTLNGDSKSLLDDRPSIEMFGATNTSDEEAEKPAFQYEEDERDEAFNNSDNLSGLSTITENVKEQFLLNEYTLGMFKSFTDGDDDLTFSRMSKGNHKMTTEVEYIITGITDPDSALTNIVLQILAIRIICNVIHLVVDAAKRTTIMNAANAIAGWWSFGFAAIVFAIVITLLWATAESVVDVTTLIIEKEKVPLVKFANTWVTDLQGLARESIEAITNVAIDAVGKMSNDLVKTIDERIDEVSGHLSDEVKGFYESEVNRLYSEGLQMADGALTEAENQLFEALDGYITACSSGLESSFVLEDYIPITNPFYSIAQTMLAEISTAVSTDMIYSELVMARKQVTDKFKEGLEEARAEFLKGMEGVVDETIETYLGEVNSVIKDQIGKATTTAQNKLSAISKDKIESISKNTKDTMGDKLSTSPGGDSINDAGSAKGSKLAAFVPSLSYNDYLRLFMWLRYSELDERIVRMMDVMELNLAYHYYESNQIPFGEIRLEDYVIEFNVDGHYEMEQGIFLAPFLPYMNIGGFENGTFDISVVNGYD